MSNKCSAALLQAGNHSEPHAFKPFALTLLRALLFFACAFMPAGPASAAQLIIEGSAEITTEATADGVVLSGKYSITNLGDETARQVYPRFEMGGWQWAGDPRDMPPRAVQSWPFNSRISFAQISCPQNPRCAGLALPSMGFLPLLVMRHYQDLNGYSFSAPEVIRLPLASMTSMFL